MKKVLVPTDFSDNAWNAIRYATMLFAEEPIEYFLLNTYYASVPVEDAININYDDSFRKNSMEGLRQIQSRMTSELQSENAKFHLVSEYGEPEHIITELVEEKGIDLVVMGTQGANGLKEVLIGSHTAAVIGKSPCPVLAIPENATWEIPKKILFATDYKKLTPEEELSALEQIAKKFNAEILILNVLKNEKEMVKVEEAMEGFALHDFFDKIPHSYHESHFEHTEQGIEKFARENDVNLIVMLKRNHSFFERLFNKSITKQMAYHTNIPLLSLPENTHVKKESDDQ